MSFKDFYKGQEDVIKDLLEAYESFYLAESLENGTTVTLIGTGGKKVREYFPGTTYDTEDVFTYYEDLKSVPAEYKSDRELVVTIGWAGGKFQLTTDGDYMIPSGIRTGLLAYTTNEKVKEILSSGGVFEKGNVSKWLKEYSKESPLDTKTKNLYIKTLSDYFNSLDSKPFEAGVGKEFEKRINVKNIKIDSDEHFKQFQAFKVDVMKYLLEKAKDIKGIKDYSIVSGNELEYIMFGSEFNTKVFEKAYSYASQTKSEKPEESKFTNNIKLGRYYLVTPDETLYDVVYNEMQPAASLENTIRAIDTEKKQQVVKEYKMDHENSQVLGVFVPTAKSILEKVSSFEGDVKGSKFKSIIAPLVSGIKKALDSQDVKSYLQKLLEKIEGDELEKKDYETILAYVAGVSEFFKDVVKYSNPNIIFAQISEFRKAESDKMKYKKEEDYGWVSTVDFVVSDVDGDDLISFIKNKKTNLVAEKNGSINVVDEEGKVLANYFQVSLKSSTKGSSLGRNAALAQKKFGKHISKGDKLHEEVDLLNESILSKLSELGKKGFEKLKELGKGVLDKIVRLATSLRKFASTNIKEFIKESDINLNNAIKELYGDLELTEAFRNIDVKPYCAKLFAKENNKEIYMKGQAKIKDMLEKLNNKKTTNNLLVNVDVIDPAELTVENFYNQIFHYTFLLTFSELFVKAMAGERKELVSVINDIVDLYAESMFGATKLPLWKVVKFGVDETPYKLLGSKDEFKAGRKEKLSVVSSDVVLIELHGNTSNKWWYMKCLVDLLNESGKQVQSLYELGYNDKMSTSAKFKEDFEVK